MSENDETQTRTGRHAPDDVRRFTRKFRVGIDATPDTLDLGTRTEAFVQELVQRGLRPVSDTTLDELSEPVGHHTEGDLGDPGRHGQGRLPESRPGAKARHVDRRPPTGFRVATLGVDAVPAYAYDYQAAADAHIAAERAAEVEGSDENPNEVTRTDLPVYDEARARLEGMINESDQK